MVTTYYVDGTGYASISDATRGYAALPTNSKPSILGDALAWMHKRHWGGRCTKEIEQAS